MLRRGLVKQSIKAFHSTLSNLVSTFPPVDTTEAQQGQGVPTTSSWLSPEAAAADAIFSTTRILNIAMQEIEMDNRDAYESSMSDHNILVPHTSAITFSRVDNTTGDNEEAEEGKEERRGDDVHRTKLISGIVLFNLGLAYHLWALGFKKQQERKLLLAQKFYSVAREAMEKDDLTTMSPAERRVVLAIYNNHAHISFQLLHLDASLDFLSSLDHLMTLYEIDEKHDQHFLLNLIFMRTFAMTSPAA